MTRACLCWTLSAVLAGLSLTVVSGAEPPSKASSSPAVLPGHSNHGESFNEGPRQKAYLMSGTGKVSFEVSSKQPQVRAFIEQGIGQLHGYWYFEAERSFRQAATLDADCAIAYWGMAMANTNNSKRAQGFLAEALKRKEKASRREALYIDALAGYLNGKESREKKARKLVGELEKIVKEFPDDLEAQAWLAHELYRNRAQLKKSYEDVEKALKKILEREPMHPVHHFVIHLWDHKDPKKALGSSALCGQSAPGVAHMWHMPGHIYSRLRRWEDAIWQQEASARVDHAHMMRDRILPDQIHNFAHNNEWLVRNLSHLGRFQEAIALARNTIELPRHPKYNKLSGRGSASFGRQRLFELLDRFELDQEMIRLAQGPYLEPTGIETEQVRRLRQLGVAQARTGDLAGARKILAELEGRLAESRAKDRAGEKKPQPGLSPGRARKVEARIPASPARAEPKIPSTPDKPAAPKTEPGKPEPGKTDSSKAAPKKEEASKPASARGPAASAAKDKPTQEKKPAPRPRPLASPRKGPGALTRVLEQGADAIKGWIAVSEGNYKAAVPLLRRASEDGLKVARIQCLAGEKDAAVKAAESYVKSHLDQVPALAGQVEILWLAGKKKEASQAFEQLRQRSGSAQLGTPVFDRLGPIARELKLPEDWRLPSKPATDVGKRPELGTLGPAHWQPMAAPAWQLQDVDGSTHQLKDYAGKPVILVFYLGHGCLHCTEQIQALAAQAEKFRQAGLTVIGISTDDQEGLKQSLKSTEDGTFPFLLLSGSSLEVFRSYRVFDDFESLPLHGTFLVDGQGRIRWQDISYEPFMDVSFLLEESRRLLSFPMHHTTLKPRQKSASAAP